MFLIMLEEDDDHLGRQAGQMIRSLQTSLPLMFTFGPIIINTLLIIIIIIIITFGAFIINTLLTIISAHQRNIFLIVKACQ